MRMCMFLYTEEEAGAGKPSHQKSCVYVRTISSSSGGGKREAFNPSRIGAFTTPSAWFTTSPMRGAHVAALAASACAGPQGRAVGAHDPQ